MSTEVKSKEKVNMDPKYIIKLTVTLFVTCVVVAGALGLVNSVTAGPIAQINKEKTEAAMKMVVADPDNSEFSDKLELTEEMTAAATAGGGSVTEAYAVTVNGESDGYALKIVASGSQGNIEMMVGVDGEGTVTGVSIVDNSETAGIGSKGIVASTAALAVLLQEGIGDTIRVSLTEAPENEIPVAQLLVEHFADRPGEFEVLHPERYFPTEYRRRSKVTVPVVHTEPLEGFRVLEALSGNPTAELRAAILNLDIPDEPVVVKRRYEERSLETLAVKAAADLGVLLLDGLADGIWIDAPGFAEDQVREIELMILQAARVRFSHTEYIACPSCGRTLYDIEKTLADIKSRTSHLSNLKIGVMGCIVNGPGEMADADYGYVGAAPGRITLYKGRTVVARNIPQQEALDRLVELIKADGEWVEP